MVNCADLVPFIVMYSLTASFWSLFTLWWGIHCWVFQRPHVKPLHKFMFLCLIFKTGYDLFEASLYISCEGSSEPYWELAISCSFTLFNTFAYTSLLLISKGFGLTQTALSRSDLTVTAMIMGVVYLCFSAIMISPKDLLLLWFILLLSLFYMMVRNALQNLQILRGRVMELERNGLPSTSERLRAKLMTGFLICIYVFFLSQLFISIVFDLALSIGSGLNETQDFVGTAILQTFVATSLIPLFAIFRARDLGTTRTENLSTVSAGNIAPVYTADVSWSEEHSSVLTCDKHAPIVILTPCESKRILVGVIWEPRMSRQSTRTSWIS